MGSIQRRREEEGEGGEEPGNHGEEMRANKKHLFRAQKKKIAERRARKRFEEVICLEIDDQKSFFPALLKASTARGVRSSPLQLLMWQQQQ